MQNYQLGNAGQIRDQQYRIDPWCRMPSMEWQLNLFKKSWCWTKCCLGIPALRYLGIYFWHAECIPFLLHHCGHAGYICLPPPLGVWTPLHHQQSKEVHVVCVRIPLHPQGVGVHGVSIYTAAVWMCWVHQCAQTYNSLHHLHCDVQGISLSVCSVDVQGTRHRFALAVWRGRLQ